MKRFDIPLLVVLAISMGCNAFLAYQNVRLREAIPRTPTREYLALGSRLTFLTLRESPEVEVELRFPTVKKPILLYSVSSSCKWCASNAGMAKALEAAIQADYQFITLCVDGNVEGCREKTGEGPLYVPTPETVAVLKLQTVPQTILLSAEGKVERVWTGVFQNATKKELEKYFGVPLHEESGCNNSSGSAGCEGIEGHS